MLVEVVAQLKKSSYLKRSVNEGGCGVMVGVCFVGCLCLLNTLDDALVSWLQCCSS